MPSEPVLKLQTPAKMMEDDALRFKSLLKRQTEKYCMENVVNSPSQLSAVASPAVMKLDQQIVESIRSTFMEKKVMSDLNKLSGNQRVLQDLPKTADCIYSMFTSEKKTSLFWKDVHLRLLTLFSAQR
jgi:hypothetical protein